MTDTGPSVWLQAAQTDPYVAPAATPPGDLYFTYGKPDGDQFIASAANAETYLRLSYTAVGEQTLSDSDSFRDSVSPGSNEPPASGVDAEDPDRPPDTETPASA